MGRREENFELRKAVQGVRFESRALERKLDTIIGNLVHLNRKGDKLMADFSALRAAVEELKMDLADAIERLKNLPTVEDPAVQAEIDSIVADMSDADKKYDEAVASPAPEPVAEPAPEPVEEAPAEQPVSEEPAPVDSEE